MVLIYIGIALMAISMIMFLVIAGITNHLAGEGGYDSDKVLLFVELNVILFTVSIIFTIIVATFKWLSEAGII